MPFVDELFEDVDTLSRVQFMAESELILEVNGIFISQYEAAQLRNLEVAGTKPELHLRARDVTVSKSEFSNDYVIEPDMEVNVDGRTYYVKQIKNDGSGLVIIDLSVEN